ncbi:MAG TPA: dTMP kinase [Dehalococcoidia bacterium]|nr:dTMP kinase [Dehalococcoidia bacterium]
MSLFVTFEGSEGCGKSTQAKALWKKVSRLGIPAVLTHEPGGTTLSKEVRYLLKKQRQGGISPLAELLLFAACRIQLVTEIIRPNLKQGKVIICDRFADSTIAYQGYGRGLDLDTIREINQLATEGIKPDLTILLDIPVEKGLDRKQTKAGDRFETEDIAFHNRVRDGYLKLAADEPERWLVIDATLPKVRIGKIIWQRVSRLLNKHHLSRTPG